MQPPIHVPVPVQSRWRSYLYIYGLPYLPLNGSNIALSVII